MHSMECRLGELIIMVSFFISGGHQLIGEVNVKAAKNSCLPILAASILTQEQVILHNCPSISDIDNMLDILRCLNVDCVVNGDKIEVNSSNIIYNDIPCELATKLRSSIFLLGPILSLFKKAKFYEPGGCAIGKRGIDIHIDGLRQLNVKVIENDKLVYCDAQEARAGNVYLHYPSVGATENMIMLCVGLAGESVIYNAAREVEIVDLCAMLNNMGARIKGAGSSVIRITGVKKLKGVEHKPQSDRIVAGTFIVAALMNRGEVAIKGVNQPIINSIFHKIIKKSCKFYYENDKIIIENKDYKLNDYIETNPAPHFPTDMQPIIMALASITQGRRIIVENVFENRFSHANELNKMGADITCVGRAAIVNGVYRLHGNRVKASDLRAGAALTIAGMSAIGDTIVENAHYIDRGYENLDVAFNSLGAKIKRL